MSYEIALLDWNGEELPQGVSGYNRLQVDDTDVRYHEKQKRVQVLRKLKVFTATDGDAAQVWGFIVYKSNGKPLGPPVFFAVPARPVFGASLNIEPDPAGEAIERPKVEPVLLPPDPPPPPAGARNPQICPIMSRPVSDGTYTDHFIVECVGSRCVMWARINEPDDDPMGRCGMAGAPWVQPFRDPARPHNP